MSTAPLHEKRPPLCVAERITTLAPGSGSVPPPSPHAASSKRAAASVRVTIVHLHHEETFTVENSTLAYVMQTTDVLAPQRVMKALEEQLRRIREATTPHPRQSFRDAIVQAQDRTEDYGGA
jgi:hypothetical protein